MMTSSLVCAVDYAYDTRSWASIGMVEEGRRVKASCRSMGGGARGVRRGCAREWSEVMDQPPVTNKLDHVGVDAAAQNDHSPPECGNAWQDGSQEGRERLPRSRGQW